MSMVITSFAPAEKFSRGVIHPGQFRVGTTLKKWSVFGWRQQLKNLKLGVGPEPGHAVDTAFFEQYRKSWLTAQAASLPLLVTP
jgi:hypothetical protein